MKENVIYIGIAVLLAIIIIFYIIRKNLRDKKDVEKFFNEKVRKEKRFKFDDDEF